MSVTRYVAGFLTCGRYVLLMEKNRPAWQVGKLNGVGGHIENGETDYEAMRREFEEETGGVGYDWRRVVTLRGVDFEVVFFVAEVDTIEELTAVRLGATDEPMEIHVADRLPMHVVGNLHWIIPLCMDKDRLVADVTETSGWTGQV